MASELDRGVDGVVPEEKTSSYRKPYIPHNVGITESAGEAVPAGDLELPFRAVDDRFPKCDRKADGRIEDLVVIGEVIYVTTEVVGVQADLAEETFGGADFEVVAVGGLDWQSQHAGVQRAHCHRAGKKNIFE